MKAISANRLSRCICLFLAFLLFVGVLPAQEPAKPKKLNIIIVEGEGAVNNIRERVAREPIVQVEDENRRPVAGAVVVFLLPNQGPGGNFADGARSLTVTTDESGRAAARGFRPNTQTGEYEIRVRVSKEGLAESAVIGMSNLLGPSVGGGASGKTIAIVAVAAAVATGIILGVTLGGNGGTTTPAPPSPPPAITITPGTPSIGGPG